jgi:hypothetical protein
MQGYVTEAGESRFDGINATLAEQVGRQLGALWLTNEQRGLPAAGFHS